MLKFALAGNPNCGKTTLFNTLTGSTAHVGNWPGVTVDKREGVYKKLSEHINIVDLPGIYSLSPYTPEEVVSRNFILEEKPDCVINIVDATNLERNLYLTTQIMEIDVPVVVPKWDESLCGEPPSNPTVRMSTPKVCPTRTYAIRSPAGERDTPNGYWDGCVSWRSGAPESQRAVSSVPKRALLPMAGSTATMCVRPDATCFESIPKAATSLACAALAAMPHVRSAS